MSIKGILTNRRNWVRLEDSSILDIDEIKINNNGKNVSYGTLPAGEEKSKVTQAYELEINKIYRALNGESKPKDKIGNVVRNSINAGTFSSIFTPAVEMFMLDYVRPQLLASTYLATTIPVGKSLNRSILAMVRAFGLVKVKEVAKNGVLPIVSPNLGEYTEQIAYDIKKYGVKLEIDKDLQNSDEFGILGYLFTSIADAFRDRKEFEVLKVVSNVGEVMYDNATPSQGTFKVHTSGRGRDGAFNGTVTIDDFLKIFAYANLRGVTPTTIVVNPYVLFNMVGDNELSVLLGVTDGALSPAAKTAFDPGWGHPFGESLGYTMKYYGAGNEGLGGGNQVQDWGKIGMGPLGTMGVDPFSTGVNTTGGYHVGKTKIAGMNLQVVALPQVPTVTVAGPPLKIITNIFIVGDKKPVGILQEHGPAPIEWEDVEREIDYLGFREKYSTIPLYQGRGVYTIKNVVIDKNYSNFSGQYNVPTLTDPDGTAIVT